MNTVLKDVHLDASTDLQVMEAIVERQPTPRVRGTLRNNTDRTFRSAELTFDLTNSFGSQVGAVSTTVHAVAPKSTVAFQVPIKQADAAIVLVREVRPE
jgi:hypothetical protein